MSDKKIKIKIDGKDLEVAEGASVLQVALDEGIMVPHFCYHPGMGVDGNCRLCLVEVEGMPKLATSCNLYAKEGMVVRTQSDPVAKARKGVIEFILLNHPLDCPFCDKGGECPLQNYTMDTGQETTRFEFEKNHKAKHQVVGEHIVLDKERCVLCSRCVRFGRDFAGHEELQITNRGSKSEIFVSESAPLSSKFTGNYADICPVGALTTREYRFKARPWELKTVNTVCGDCSLGCSVQAWKKDMNLLRLTPRVEPEVNEWWLCDRGRFSIHRYSKEDRTSGIYQRENSVLKKLGAQEGLSLLLAEVFKSNPAKTGFWVDSSMTNEDFFQVKSIAAQIKAEVFLPVKKAVREVYAHIKTQGQNIDFPTSLESNASLLVIGTLIEESHPVMAIRFRTLARKNGLKLFLAHTQKSELSNVSEAVAVSDWKNFFNSLESLIKEKEIKQVLISDTVINENTAPLLLATLKNQNVKATVLFSGANDRGLLDSSDGKVLSREDLSPNFDSFICYGEVPLELESMTTKLKTFVHAVTVLSKAHPKATHVIPLDEFTEKSGTYANHFGKVQVLKKAVRYSEKGTSTYEVLKFISESMGSLLTLDEVYSKLAEKVTGYPKKLSDIPESKKTYHHYERATWR